MQLRSEIIPLERAGKNRRTHTGISAHTPKLWSRKKTAAGTRLHHQTESRLCRGEGPNRRTPPLVYGRRMFPTVAADRLSFASVRYPYRPVIRCPNRDRPLMADSGPSRQPFKPLTFWFRFPQNRNLLMVSASARKCFASVSCETFQEENARVAAKSEHNSVKCFASAR